MDKRANNGGHSTKPQRPDDKRLLTKTELQDAYESLKPFHPEALRQLEMAMKAGEKWAVELWFKYFFRMPTQTIDQNTNHNFNAFELKDILNFKND